MLLICNSGTLLTSNIAGCGRQTGRPAGVEGKTIGYVPTWRFGALERSLGGPFAHAVMRAERGYADESAVLMHARKPVACQRRVAALSQHAALSEHAVLEPDATRRRSKRNASRRVPFHFGASACGTPRPFRKMR
jgi:hypothetical protein